MTTAPPRRTPVTEALATLLAQATMRPTWGPDGPDPTATNYGLMPYLVVELVGNAVSYGDVASPDGMADVVWQVTAVGETPTSAQIAMDAARSTVLTRDDSSDGFLWPISCLPTVVIDRRFDSDGGTQVEGGITNVVERYRLTLHSSAS